MPKYDNFEQDFDFEMEEIENDFGSSFSKVTQKVKKTQKKNHKEPKFHKDGYLDKNRK